MDIIICNTCNGKIKVPMKFYGNECECPYCNASISLQNKTTTNAILISIFTSHKKFIVSAIVILTFIAMAYTGNNSNCPVDDESVATVESSGIVNKRSIAREDIINNISKIMIAAGVNPTKARQDSISQADRCIAIARKSGEDITYVVNLWLVWIGSGNENALNELERLSKR